MNSVTSSAIRNVVQVGLLGEFVAETNAVVEHAKDEHQPPGLIVLLLQRHPQLVVIVADVLLLAPRLRPGFIVRVSLDGNDLEVRRQLRAVGQHETEPRRADHLLSKPSHRIHRGGIMQFDVDREIAVRRADCFGTCRNQAQRRRAEHRHGEATRRQKPSYFHLDAFGSVFRQGFGHDIWVSVTDRVMLRVVADATER